MLHLKDRHRATLGTAVGKYFKNLRNDENGDGEDQVEGEDIDDDDMLDPIDIETMDSE